MVSQDLKLYITFWSGTTTYNSFGAPKELVLVECFGAYANKQDELITQVYEHGIHTINITTFGVRFDPRITYDHKIKYKGVYYDIAVIPEPGPSELVKLKAEMIVNK